MKIIEWACLGLPDQCSQPWTMKWALVLCESHAYSRGSSATDLKEIDGRTFGVRMSFGSFIFFSVKLLSNLMILIQDW